MECRCMDLPPESKLGQFLANRSVAVSVAVIQIVIGIIALLTLFPHDPNDPASLSISVLIRLICIGFSVLLLVGIMKDKMQYVLSYQKFIVILTVLALIAFVIIPIARPDQLTASRVISSIIVTLLNLLFLFMIRNYYISFKLKQENAIPSPNEVTVTTS